MTWHLCVSNHTEWFLTPTLTHVTWQWNAEYSLTSPDTCPWKIRWPFHPFGLVCLLSFPFLCPLTHSLPISLFRSPCFKIRFDYPEGICLGHIQFLLLKYKSHSACIHFYLCFTLSLPLSLSLSISLSFSLSLCLSFSLSFSLSLPLPLALSYSLIPSHSHPHTNMP